MSPLSAKPISCTSEPSALRIATVSGCGVTVTSNAPTLRRTGFVNERTEIAGDGYRRSTSAGLGGSDSFMSTGLSVTRRL